MIDELKIAKRVNHIPLCPPRAETPGEGIYLDLWREWVSCNPEEWLDIFTTARPPCQRAASVAASFMVFMGCNAGAAFTHEAEARASTTAWREQAFLSVWGTYNARTTGVNSGWRTIETMLSSEHGVNRKRPVVTMEDIDVVEDMVRWWSGPAAGVIRKIAKPAIAAANEKLLSRMFQRHEGGAV